MTDIIDQGLQKDFDTATQKRSLRAVMIDADLVEWFEAIGADPAFQINDLVRFYMDSSRTKEREFEPEAWEPGEMQEPAPG